MLEPGKYNIDKLNGKGQNTDSEGQIEEISARQQMELEHTEQKEGITKKKDFANTYCELDKDSLVCSLQCGPGCGQYGGNTEPRDREERRTSSLSREPGGA